MRRKQPSTWAYVRARFAVDPAYKARHAQLHEEHRKRLRDAAIDAYGAQCACCGERERRFLCIDHVYGGGNEDRRQNKTWIYVRLKREGYPPDYQLLCHNCNWAKSHGGCPHDNPAGLIKEARAMGVL